MEELMATPEPLYFWSVLTTTVHLQFFQLLHVLSIHMGCQTESVQTLEARMLTFGGISLSNITPILQSSLDLPLTMRG